MAALNAVNPTLLDLAKRMDPDNKIATIIELLNQTNAALDDIPWFEGNLVTGHTATVRTGIPEPTWRKFNAGVQPSKSTTAQVTFNTGMLENYSQIDKALAELNGNTAAFRLSEDRPIIEGFNQKLMDYMFYGNQGSEPEAITGLANYYAATTAESGDNLILGGGSGTDNASIYLVVWGENTIGGLYPKGTTAGLQHRDLGEVTTESPPTGSGLMQVLRAHYQWKCGLFVKDWRYGVRIANIDKSALTKDAASGADLPDLMFQALETVENTSMGRPAFYMSRSTMSFLRRQMANKTKDSTLAIEDVGGRKVMTFQGIPVRRVDALAADEALVS